MLLFGVEGTGVLDGEALFGLAEVDLDFVWEARVGVEGVEVLSDVTDCVDFKTRLNISAAALEIGRVSTWCDDNLGECLLPASDVQLRDEEVQQD